MPTKKPGRYPWLAACRQLELYAYFSRSEEAYAHDATDKGAISSSVIRPLKDTYLIDQVAVFDKKKSKRY
ncbi:hypothetical protein EN829_054130 [Mesorhizobium sp. M00.F.Ca.ET.186.01.1.1]|nr:hypothetical protein EN829_054130 [Mesorhizobium sp. M00.F.Ca.ET.186.01.1.1]